MRRKITVFLIIAVCYLLQSTVFQALSFASISPNLMIVVVSAFGFMRGKKRRTVDWLFHGSSFRYFYRKYSGILRIALYVCGLFQRIFPENVLPGRYQTADASDRSQRFFMQSDHLFPVIFIPWKV